ncbi:MAG: cobalt-precorrin-5B (C(1))-methyltransferase CbiD [Pseudomonadota bacterium]
MKPLRRGYTTGACAQAAVRAAALSLGGGLEGAGRRKHARAVEIALPNGETTTFRFRLIGPGVCSVVKDAGDDPDITDGVEVVASVSPRGGGRFDVGRGEGVGLVTLDGLAVRPGRPAINPVPLRHIRAELRSVLPAGARAVISIPGGEELARRTFNPRLGIEGGLSVLGTTGRVEPWSRAAYQESLLPQLDVALAAGIEAPVLVPGAKGERAALAEGFDPRAVVHTGNYFGMMLQAARERGIGRAVLVGHASKLAKIARGDFDTHSRRSPTPLDVIAGAAMELGLGKRKADALSLLPTTEAAVAALAKSGDTAVLDAVAGSVRQAVASEYGIEADVLLTDGSGRVMGRA